MPQNPDELTAILQQLLLAARKPELTLPAVPDLSHLPRADRPRPLTRQYATLAELERACGDHPDTVEQWLAARHPTVVSRLDPPVRWRSLLDGRTPPAAD